MRAFRSPFRIIFFCFLLTVFLPSCYKNEPVPVAVFTFAGDNNFKVPCNVIFTNHSTDAFSWDWKFGDDSTSVLKDPTHLYTRPGTYNVYLRAYTESRKEWASVTHQVVILDTIVR